MTKIYRKKNDTTVDIDSMPQSTVYGWGSHLKDSEGKDFGHVPQATAAANNIILISPNSPKPSRARKEGDSSYTSFCSSQVAKDIISGKNTNLELVERGYRNTGNTNTYYVEVKVGSFTYKYAWNMPKSRQDLLKAEFANLGIKKSGPNDLLIFSPETNRPTRLYKNMKFTVDGGSGDTTNRVTSFASTAKVDSPSGGWAISQGKNGIRTP